SWKEPSAKRGSSSRLSPSRISSCVGRAAALIRASVSPLRAAELGSRRLSDLFTAPFMQWPRRTAPTRRAALRAPALALALALAIVGWSSPGIAASSTGARGAATATVGRGGLAAFIDTRPRGRPVPDGFLGLSYELSTLP